MSNFGDLDAAPLGANSTYIDQYDPGLLFPIERDINRKLLGINEALPFIGHDQWNAYEVSFLNTRGKPIILLADFIFPCHATHIVESKSFKLYLNSFNQTRFDSIEKVRQLMQDDLSAIVGLAVGVRLFAHDEQALLKRLDQPQAYVLDELDVDINCYETDSALLEIDESEEATECFISHLLRSRCPVTAQPDWGSVTIQYTGKRIIPESLLRYIVSFRKHQEFHEQCVERMFVDIVQRCQPQDLAIQANFLRRGGLDINPYRSMKGTEFSYIDVRYIRQ